MNSLNLLKILLILAAAFIPAPFLGSYMSKVYRGEAHALSFLAPAERLFYRLARIQADEEMGWKEYAVSLLAFNALGLLLLSLILMTQGWLPLNPQHFPNISWHLALNTAVSFVTNTNWQAYAGETSMSYLSQVAGLALQNFASAATGAAVALVLARSLAQEGHGEGLREILDKFAALSREGEKEALNRHRTEEARPRAALGNFWVDITRTTLYILLPLSLVLAILLVAEGVPQNFAPYARATSLEGRDLLIPMGPAASQIAIKQLGSNGGGFFGANSAHPFENPSPFSNALEFIAILLLPAAFPFLFGEIVGRKKQGWAIFAAMALIFAAGLALSLYSESAPNPSLGLHASLEGKETRLGIVDSALWTEATTAVSSGSVNNSLDSASPGAIAVASFNLMLGEVVFGGVGAGLYGILVFVFVTVFIAGLMVGRSPEFLGRRIEAREIKLSMIAVIAPSFVILAFSSIALICPAGRAPILNPGPRGYAEVLYAFSSAAANNGSALGGLNANTVFYNLLSAAGMLIGRFGVILPVLGIAGGLARKRRLPRSLGTFPTEGFAFSLLLAAVILIVGGLSFFPALSLGPIVEALLKSAGRLF